MKTTDTHVYFLDENSFLSNWYQMPYQFKDNLREVAFWNTEQAFIWYKAFFFNDLEACALIEQEKEPVRVRAIGRTVKHYHNPRWEFVREGFMMHVNYLKFRGPLLSSKLLETGKRKLVEASPTDNTWGCGFAEDDPFILDEAKWTGQNLLGECLMKVRATILNDSLHWK